MLVGIDKQKCVGCGLCEETVPALFETGRYTAEVTCNTVPPVLIDRVLKLANECPAEAIVLRQDAS